MSATYAQLVAINQEVHDGDGEVLCWDTVAVLEEVNGERTEVDRLYVVSSEDSGPYDAALEAAGYSDVTWLDDQF